MPTGKRTSVSVTVGAGGVAPSPTPRFTCRVVLIENFCLLSQSLVSLAHTHSHVSSSTMQHFPCPPPSETLARRNDVLRQACRAGALTLPCYRQKKGVREKLMKSLKVIHLGSGRRGIRTQASWRQSWRDSRDPGLSPRHGEAAPLLWTIYPWAQVLGRFLTRSHCAGNRRCQGVTHNIFATCLTHGAFFIRPLLPSPGRMNRTAKSIL